LAPARDDQAVDVADDVREALAAQHRIEALHAVASGPGVFLRHELFGMLPEAQAHRF
jgi:hypothetical protein